MIWAPAPRRPEEGAGGASRFPLISLLFVQPPIPKAKKAEDIRYNRWRGGTVGESLVR